LVFGGMEPTRRVTLDINAVMVRVARYCATLEIMMGTAIKGVLAAVGIRPTLIVSSIPQQKPMILEFTRQVLRCGDLQLRSLELQDALEGLPFAAGQNQVEGLGGHIDGYFSGEGVDLG